MLSEQSSKAIFYGGADINALKSMVRAAIDARLSTGWESGGDLVKAFHMFDRERSGFISYQRVSVCLKDFLGLDVDEIMLAKLMSEYDPESTGRVDYANFVLHVMGSQKGGQMGHPHDAKQLTKAPRAQPGWSLEKVEGLIKLKMTKAWTQMISEMRMLDKGKNGRILRQDLRNILDKFCLILDDKMLDRVLAKFCKKGENAVSINEFVHYFEKYDSKEGLFLSSDLSVEETQATICEKINGKLEPGDGQLRRAFYIFNPTHAPSISYAKFEQVLRDSFMIRLHPELKSRLMAHFDPAVQGQIDFSGFSRNVMGSSPGGALSYDNEEPAEIIKTDTKIWRSWGFEKVEDCIRQHLTGTTGQRFASSLCACDLTRNGTISIEDLRAVLASEKLDMNQSQFENLIRNFKRIPGSTLRTQEIIDTFVDNTSKEHNDAGDPYWHGYSVDSMKTVIRTRIESRIGAGPDQHRRVWKYFAPDRSKKISLKAFRKQLKIDLNLNLSEKMCDELAASYSMGQGDQIGFLEFVTRVMGYTNDDFNSLEPVKGAASHTSHVQGNSEMFIRNKVRSSWNEMSTAFKRADRDESGLLHASQVKRVLRRFAIDLTPAQFTQLLKDMQADDSGNMEFRNFLTLFESKELVGRNCRQSLAQMDQKAAVHTLVEKLQMKYGGSYERDTLRRALKTADVTGTGSISIAQLGRVLSKMTDLEATPSQIIALLSHLELEHNRNGVDYADFCVRIFGGQTGLETRVLSGTSLADTWSRPSSAASEPTEPVDSGAEWDTASLSRLPASHAGSDCGSVRSRASSRSSMATRRAKHLATLAANSIRQNTAKYRL